MLQLRKISMRHRQGVEDGDAPARLDASPCQCEPNPAPSAGDDGHFALETQQVVDRACLVLVVDSGETCSATAGGERVGDTSIPAMG